MRQAKCITASYNGFGRERQTRIVEPKSLCTMHGAAEGRWGSWFSLPQRWILHLGLAMPLCRYLCLTPRVLVLIQRRFLLYFRMLALSVWFTQVLGNGADMGSMGWVGGSDTVRLISTLFCTHVTTGFSARSLGHYQRSMNEGLLLRRHWRNGRDTIQSAPAAPILTILVFHAADLRH